MFGKLLKGMLTLGVAGGLAVGGWLAYEKWFAPPDFKTDLKVMDENVSYYSHPHNLEILIQEENGVAVPYLVDRENSRKQPITSGFQLGSPSYRLYGFYKEGGGQVLDDGKALVDFLRRTYSNQ
jgi:hypothetical protein